MVLWFFPRDASAAQPGHPPECDREPRCQKTTRRTILAQPPEFFEAQSLWSNSCFVRCPLQCTSHHLPRRATRAVPVRRVPCIAQCLSHPICASHYSVLGNTQNCSCSIMMTNEDALSHAAPKELTPSSPILQNQTFPLQILPLAFSMFVQFVSVHSFSIFTRKRGNQLSSGLSSAMRTLVFCSAEKIRKCSALSFHFSHSHFRTTVGHVIILRWSLRNHFHSRTCVNHRILK